MRRSGRQCPALGRSPRPAPSDQSHATASERGCAGLAPAGAGAGRAGGQPSPGPSGPDSSRGAEEEGSLRQGCFQRCGFVSSARPESASARGPGSPLVRAAPGHARSSSNRTAPTPAGVPPRGPHTPSAPAPGAAGVHQALGHTHTCIYTYISTHTCTYIHIHQYIYKHTIHTHTHMEYMEWNISWACIIYLLPDYI